MDHAWFAIDDRPAPKVQQPQPLIHPSARIYRSRLGPWTEIGERVTLDDVELGAYSYVAGTDGDIAFSDIGRFCSIASHVRIGPGQHPMQRPTQHHLTYRSAQYALGQDDHAFFAGRRAARVRIGHDVWIGHGAVIMPGVTVGIGAVIGAHSVVTRDIPDFAIVVGSPGRVLRSRFPANIQARLLASAWWEWDHQQLAQRLPELRDLERFLALTKAPHGDEPTEASPSGDTTRHRALPPG